jgi:two-component system sensor histidine kinase PilS (NtrC family)
MLMSRVGTIAMLMKRENLAAAFARLVQSGQIAQPSQRERNYLRAYRVVIGLLGVVLTFAAYERAWIQFDDLHVARAVAIGYFGGAVVLILYAVNEKLSAPAELVIGLALDIAVISMAMALTSGVETVLPLLLLVSLAGTTHYLPVRLATGAAAAAVIAMLLALFSHGIDGGVDQVTANAAAIGIVCFVVAAIASLVGARARTAEALAERRSAELIDLDRLNDLVVQRMRTGVLVLDRTGRIQRMNESAWRMLGGPKRSEAPISAVSSTLHDNWQTWRTGAEQPQIPSIMAEGGSPVLPRFLRLFAERDDLTVVFLDDATLLNQRAEALTLDTLGRLSASIAHELRNPLAAIQQSGQLLAESTDLPSRDKRLVEIIGKHSQRLERIVRGVLDLAKREGAKPETIELETWLTRYLDEFRMTRLPEADELVFISPSRECEVLFDPVHLEQVVGNLLGNALNYGRRADTTLRITVTMDGGRRASDPLLVSVADNGAGIAPDRVDQAFKPFYSTGVHGTGLGLYLCRELCEANGADLDYEPVPEGGASFVIHFHRQAMLGGAQPPAG